MSSVWADFTLRWRRAAIIAAVIWFLTCLLWGAPAFLLATVLRPFAPQLQLQVFEGSFWNGRAAQAFWQQDNQRIALGSVEWHIKPWSLLWLHPSLHVTTNYDQQFVDTSVRFSPLGAMQLRDTRAAVPFALLSHWLPLPGDGLIGVKFDYADIAQGQLRAAHGEVMWQQAVWQWNSRWLPLGDYRCQLDMPSPDQLHCVLQGQGALGANGEMTFNFKEKTYSLQAKIIPGAELPADFRDGLGVLLGGQRDASGQWSLQRNGHW